MTEEELKNKEKRKSIPLTKEEYLTFFFFPFNSYAKEFNDSEDRRFERYGFETKLKQAKIARTLGSTFYGICFVILCILIKHFNIL